MKRKTKKKINKILVLLMTIALLANPTYSLAGSEGQCGSSEITIEEIFPVTEPIGEVPPVAIVEMDDAPVANEIEEVPAVAIADIDESSATTEIEDGVDLDFEIPNSLLEEQDEEEPYLFLSQTSWEPGPQSDSITISVTSNSPWGGIFPEPQDWLTIPLEGVTTQVGNGSFMIRVTANTSNQPRTTRVSIGGLAGTPQDWAVITITQQGTGVGVEPEPPFLYVTPLAWNANGAGDERLVLVDANVSWTATSNNPDWLIVGEGSGSGEGSEVEAFILTALTNGAGQSPRTGSVTIRGMAAGGVITETITVTQQAIPGEVEPEPSFLYVSPLAWNANGAGDELEVEVDANISWTATSNNPNWLVVEHGSGSGEGDEIETFTLTALANEAGPGPRTGSVTIRGMAAGGVITETITVTQQPIQEGEDPEPPFLNVNPLVWNTCVTGDSRRVFVETNAPWTATSNNPDWLVVADGSGTGEESRAETFRLTAQPYDGEGRTGTVTVQTVAEGNVNTEIITVNQEIRKSYLRLSSDTWETFAGESSTTIVLYTNTRWRGTSSAPEWLSVNPKEGSLSGGFLTIRVTANHEDVERVGTITISGIGADGVEHSAVFTVTQGAGGEPFFLELSRSVWVADMAGDSTAIEVSSNVEWRISMACSNHGRYELLSDWLRINTRAGVGDGTFEILVLPNNDRRNRQAIITVSGGGISSQVRVWQIGEPERPHLETFMPTINPRVWWASPSGDSITVSVYSNVHWEVIHEYRVGGHGWLSFSRTGGSFDGSFTITAEPNPHSFTREAFVTVRNTQDSGGRLIRVIQSSAMPEINFWYSDSNLVSFFPHEINVYTVIHGEPSPGFEQYLRDGVTEARQAWGEALGVYIGESLTPDNAQIVIHGGSREALESFMRGMNIDDELGVYGVGIPTSGRVIGEVVVNGQRKNLGEIQTSIVLVIDQGETSRKHHQAFYRALTIHEMGHALGWIGHSNAGGIMDPNSFMDPTSDFASMEITENEARHLRQIYDFFR